MKNLFFRLYLFIIVMVIGLGWSLDRLYDEHMQEANVTTDLDLHKGTFFLLNRELARQSAEQQQDYLSAISASFGYPLSLQPAYKVIQGETLNQTPLTESQQFFLEEGGIVTIFDDFSGESWFIQRYAQSENIIVIGPIVNHSSTENDAIFTSVFLFGLALAVFVWVWPISKGLVNLTRAAEQFGKGEFDARVDAHVAAPLKPLAERFNSMAQRIQRLIKSHKELSHAVSHELRTPIARIRFAMEMVSAVDCNNSRQKYLTTMDENIVELDSLVDELLVYARFDREEPQLTIKPIPLCKVIADTLAKFQMIHSHLRFELKTALPVETLIQCDEDAMVRVLDNLVRNAVRYAETHILIQLQINDGHTNLSINDDGPGIPPSSWQTLFEPFVRLDQSRDRNSGGIGLGLAIVKRYVELHKGSISIGQSDMGGAAFIIDLPASA